KLSFTWSLKGPAAQTRPLLVHTAVPHFHSSVTSGAASGINLRSRASSLPRQSPSSVIILVMSCEAFASPPLLFFMSSPSLVQGPMMPIRLSYFFVLVDLCLRSESSRRSSCAVRRIDSGAGSFPRKVQRRPCPSL